MIPIGRNAMKYRKIADRARRSCSALDDLTDRRPQRWRMIHSVAKQLGVSWDEAKAAAGEAEILGWLTMEGRHSVCLTEAQLDPLGERKAGGN
jgi:hypothetical protein